MKNQRQRQFCARLRPVFCTDGRFAADAALVKKMSSGGDVKYVGGKGRKGNGYHFDGPSSSFPGELLTPDEVKAKVRELA